MPPSASTPSLNLSSPFATPLQILCAPIASAAARRRPQTLHPFTQTVGIIIQEAMRFALVWTYAKLVGTNATGNFCIGAIRSPFCLAH